MRASRIFERYATEDEFKRAAQEAVRSFAYRRETDKDGTGVLYAPGHSEAIRQRELKSVWRPFRSKHIALDGYEAPVSGLVSFLLRNFPIETFYDVGAAVGFFTFLAAGTEKKSIKVHAFEMSPGPYDRLIKRIAESPNVAARIAPHLAGLSDRHEGTKQVWYSRTHMFETKPAPSEYREAWHRRLKFALQGIKDRDQLKEVSLLLTSIDAFAQQHDRPQCMKVDVDGYEGKVLKGAEQVLRSERPFVVLELHQDDHIERTGWSRKSVTQFLFDLGYSAVCLANHHNVREAELEAARPGSGQIAKQATNMFLFY